MLPFHLVAGVVLGWMEGRGGTPTRVLVAIGAAFCLLWGVVVAVNVERSGDSDWWPGLVAGTALAVVNLIAGSIAGALAGRAVQRLRSA